MAVSPSSAHRLRVLRGSFQNLSVTLGVGRGAQGLSAWPTQMPGLVLGLVKPGCHGRIQGRSSQVGCAGLLFSTQAS